MSLKSEFDRTLENPTPCAECSVRKMALFKGVPHDYLDWTQSYRSNQYQLGPKQMLLHEGEPSEFAFTLFSGWLKIYKSLNNGKQQVLRFALPGDFIGFQPNLQGPMTYSVRTLTDVTVCAFPRNRFVEMVKTQPDLAMRLATLNARYMSLCQHYLVGTGQKSAKERIGFLLLELWHRTRDLQLATNGDEITCPLSQEDIGEATGLTTVHVNRILKELRSDGLVTTSKGRFEILDVATLSEIAHFDASIVQNELI